MKNYGEYGGKVLRGINSANGTIKKGTVLSAKEVEKWPLQNRMGLSSSGKVLWYGPPSDSEVQVRSQGAPAPRRRTTTLPETPAPAARPRRAR